MDRYKLARKVQETSNKLVQGNDEFSNLDPDVAASMPEDLKVALAEANERAKKEAKEAMVGTIMEVLKVVSIEKKGAVEQLRRYRECERLMKMKLKLLDIAVAFGHETGIYTPVMMITDGWADESGGAVAKRFIEKLKEAGITKEQVSSFHTIEGHF